MDQIHIIIQSIFAFCIVNIDEFIVLLLFFTKAIAPHHPHTDDDDDDDQLTVFQIISGQIIGFTIIIGISLFGSLFGVFIPYDYLALLGFFPLVLGLYELYKVVNYWRKQFCSRTTSHVHEIEENRPLNSDYSSYQNSQPSTVTVARVPSSVSDISDSDNEEEEVESNILTRCFEKYFQPFLHKNVLYVALILLGDGSEEIAVFLPFLSTISHQQGDSSTDRLTVWQKTGTLFVIIIVWYLLILCQCYFAYLLIIYHSESYGKWISRYSKNVIPLVLIGLGVIILRDSIIGKILFLNKMKIL